MSKLYTQIVKSDNSSVVSIPVNITLEQIKAAQYLCDNHIEFNDMLSEQQLDIHAVEILTYINESAENHILFHDFVQDLKEIEQNEFSMLQFDIEDIGYVIMGFDKKSVTKEAKAVVKEIKEY